MLLRVELSLKITQKIEGKLDNTEGNITKTYLLPPYLFATEPAMQIVHRAKEGRV